MSLTTSLAPRPPLMAVALCGVLALAACGTNDTPAAPAAAAPTGSTPAGGSSPSSTGAATGAAVAVAATSLGQVVVDARGMTLYMYTKDTRGATTSACTGQCLVAWPPVLATGAPTANGVTGALGTIDTPDGKKQVTLDGWPLYTYAKDTKPGDTTGQNVGTVWFVLDPAGQPVRAASGTATGG